MEKQELEKLEVVELQKLEVEVQKLEVELQKLEVELQKLEVQLELEVKLELELENIGGQIQEVRRPSR